jgi:hypothetical protein
MEKLVDDHWQTEIQQKSLNLKPGYGMRDAAFPGSRRSCVQAISGPDLLTLFALLTQTIYGRFLYLLLICHGGNT